jgi:hypothetical protein
MKENRALGNASKLISQVKNAESSRPLKKRIQKLNRKNISKKNENNLGAEVSLMMQKHNPAKIKSSISNSTADSQEEIKNLDLKFTPFSMIASPLILSKRRRG